jgi:hypothetical protein
MKPPYWPTYLPKQYPKGRVRKSRSCHICNGSLNGSDPGCGRQIEKGQLYFDTGEHQDKLRVGRFCSHCASLITSDDVFDRRESGS